MAFVVSATQPPNGSLGDEWFNPNTNELRKLVAVNGTNATYFGVNQASVFSGNIGISNVIVNTSNIFYTYSGAPLASYS